MAAAAWNIELHKKRWAPYRANLYLSVSLSVSDLPFFTRALSNSMRSELVRDVVHTRLGIRALLR